MFRHVSSRQIISAIVLGFIISMAVAGCGKSDANTNLNASASQEAPVEEYVDDNGSVK